ncbi:hypothetical protein ACX1I0_05220 [Yersinia enterocolitica]
MAYEFVIDECYLAKIFQGIDNNRAEIRWLIDFSVNSSNGLASIFITEDFMKKSFDNVPNSTVFYSNESNDRDLVLEYNLASQKNYTDYDVAKYYEDQCECIYDHHYFLSSKKNGILIGSEECENKCWWNNNTMGVINGSVRYLDVLRHITKNKIMNEDEWTESCKYLFPNLFINFSNKTKLDNLNILDGSLALAWVIDSYAYLNDYSQDDYNSIGDFKSIAQYRGFDITPETSTKRKDQAAMAQRNILINGESVLCEWHIKYAPHYGRIHFNFGFGHPKEVLSLTEGKPIVGILTRHLD